MVLGKCSLGNRFNHWTSIGRLFGSGAIFILMPETLYSIENKWSFAKKKITFCIFKLFFCVSLCADSGKNLGENSSLISLILREISSCSQQRNIQISFQRVPFGISKRNFPTFQFYKTQGFVWFRKHFLFHVVFSHLIAKISPCFYFGYSFKHLYKR